MRYPRLLNRCCFNLSPEQVSGLRVIQPDLFAFAVASVSKCGLTCQFLKDASTLEKVVAGDFLPDGFELVRFTPGIAVTADCRFKVSEFFMASAVSKLSLADSFLDAVHAGLALVTHFVFTSLSLDRVTGGHETLPPQSERNPRSRCAVPLHRQTAA